MSLPPTPHPPPTPLGHHRASTELSSLAMQKLPGSFTHGPVYVSGTLAGRSTLSFPTRVHTSVLFVCVSIPALQTGSSVPFSRFHTYALIYGICFSLSDFPHCSSTSLPLTPHYFECLVPLWGCVPTTCIPAGRNSACFISIAEARVWAWVGVGSVLGLRRE